MSVSPPMALPKPFAASPLGALTPAARGRQSGAAGRLRQLVVRPSGLVVANKHLLGLVPHLKAGAPIELVPPKRRGGAWHLDTRPTAARNLPAGLGAVNRFYTGHVLRREHFLQPAINARRGAQGGALGTAGIRDRLFFALGPEVPAAPGYYQLIPLR